VISLVPEKLKAEFVEGQGMNSIITPTGRGQDPEPQPDNRGLAARLGLGSALFVSFLVGLLSKTNNGLQEELGKRN